MSLLKEFQASVESAFRQNFINFKTKLIFVGIYEVYNIKDQ